MKSKAPLKILIIDDEMVVRETLEAMLNHFGQATDSAPDGLAGQEKMVEKDYDVALVDIRMPGMDGLTLLKWSKQRQRSPQIIIMSGHGEEETQKIALQHGAFAFLHKPFAMGDIKQLIDQLQNQTRVA